MSTPTDTRIWEARDAQASQIASWSQAPRTLDCVMKGAFFTYSATVTRSTSRTWGFADGSITLQLFTGTPDKSDTTYPVQQTCSGTALTAAQSVGAGNTTIAPNQSLSAGGSRTLCAVVAMVTAAPNSDQGKSGVLRVDVSAAQVTS
ncbi:hypothetical protein NYS52_17765 [Curtobacterium flaccumfaciens pv. flaccumfaciens]|uniref:hypothetical protein n=1 Tax=Curtobacterium poinsettiae TaxID=159612 RepID=UPI00217EF96D|nr:hypothetical protein [Curtobacterium flaccumfaciens]MCS6576378.1 hypothetical protein [Curtobacterium flaccumfaciens pv. flaccumfaciens]